MRVYFDSSAFAKRYVDAKRTTLISDDVAKVAEFLLEQAKNRPTKRTTLEHHVVHILGNRVTEKVARAGGPSGS